MYDGGGYIVELKGSINDMLLMLTRLEKENWIDKQTKAVFLELTVYNPNAQLYSVAAFLVEFLQTDAALPFSSVSTLKVKIRLLMF